MKSSFKQIVLNEEDFNSFAADFLYKSLKTLSEKKTNISVALSGGSTPLPVLSKLRESNLNWEYFNFFLVDERNVSITNPLSNFGNINKVFLRDLKSVSYSIIDVKNSFEKCAENYEKLLFSKVPLGTNDLPIFDLILLGFGDDGHTASLFPGTEGLYEKSKLVVINSIPQLMTKRITLTFPVLLNASKILILAKGPSKYKIVQDIENAIGEQYPIARIINSDVPTTCILGLDYREY